MMRCKLELNPRTQEDPSVSLQPLAYSVSMAPLGTSYELKYACSYMFLWILHVMGFGICITCLHTPIKSPCWGKASWLGPSSQGCSATQHWKPRVLLPYGACGQMALLLQNRVNSNVMSLGMLFHVWCPGTDVSGANQQGQLWESI